VSVLREYGSFVRNKREILSILITGIFMRSPVFAVKTSKSVTITSGLYRKMIFVRGIMHFLRTFGE
jgi:hypothetical protein